VLGAGTIGLLVQQALRVARAREYLLLGCRRNPPEAQRGPWGHRCSNLRPDLMQEIAALTGGVGVDFAVESRRHHQTISAANRCGSQGAAPLFSSENISPEAIIPLQKVVTGKFDSRIVCLRRRILAGHRRSSATGKSM